MRRRIITILIIIATVVLAGIAVFTAYRLYQLRQEQVAPTAPESTPGAAVEKKSCEILTVPVQPRVYQCYGNECLDDSNCPTGLSCQPLGANGKNVCVNSECPSDTDCVCDEDITYECNSTCTNDGECQTANQDYICFDGFCRLENYESSQTCEATEATPTPTPPPGSTPTPPPGATPTPPPGATATPTPPPAAIATPAPELPEAGVGTPTIIGAGFGALFVLIALMLAL